jgi:hypothetical protein
MKFFAILLVSILIPAGAALAQAPGAGYPPQGMGYPPQGMGGMPGYGGGPMPGMMGGGMAPEQHEAETKPYGWNPIFGRVFGRGCLTCKKDKEKEHGVFKAKLAPPPEPQQPGGTLVFPHHQFVRSPRDFFMAD